MPYDLSEKIIDGVRYYLAKNTITGKIYHFKSARKREVGLKMHEMFSNFKKKLGHYPKKRA